MIPGRLRWLLEAQEKRLYATKYVPHGEPTFLPIWLTGGIGDVITSRTTVFRLIELGYQVLLYSHHAEAAARFYHGLTIHRGEIPGFTWIMHLNSVAQFFLTNRFEGFKIGEHRALFRLQQELFEEMPFLEPLVQNHYQHKHVLTSHAKTVGLNCSTFPLYSLGLGGAHEARPPIERFQPGRYFTIHDGYDANHAITGRATKQWKWEHWNRVVYLLKTAYPKIGITQLGGKTSRPIDGVDRNLINRTTLVEAMDILSQSMLHIDGDSGLAHAATAQGVPCVVLFGPTPASFYGHPQNANLVNQTSCSGGCFHLTKDWMNRCPIGYQGPQCLDDIRPEAVLDAVKGLL